ncbi:UDP-N-acetylmuramate dehydrogenase [soil metagenome]
MSAISQKKIEMPVVEKNVDLTTMNTMGVHAIAEHFVNITKIGELKGLFSRGFFEEYDPVVLGGGSNLLMVDNPDQPVLKISISGVYYQQSRNGNCFLTAGAGENWHNLVQRAVEKKYGGIENLALIPGTVGAAPIQNIGAYGVELQDCFEKLTAFNCETGDIEFFEREDCKFGYRDSIFKNELKGRRIICDITLRLTGNNHRLETSYKALSDHLKNKGIHKPGIQDIFDAVVEIRKSKLPDPAKIGNAGSFFKNPVVSQEKFLQLKEKYSEIPSYDMGNGEYKLPAAWLIDQAGWKGKQAGNVGTFKNQALVLVNLGGATGREIYKHAMTIRDSVQKKFGIDLNPEVNIIGSNN